MAETKYEKLERLRAQLENERSSFMSHWRDLADYILPRRPRFTASDVNRGDRRSQKIIDSTATLAARTLRSGMMGGLTSPARPWFRLTTPDPGLAEFGPVKAWLDVVTKRMSDAFLRSNLYNALPIVYGDMGVFGTAAMAVEEDFEDVIRCYPFAIGSYMIANDSKLRVNVFAREFRWTVRQVVERFGKKTRNGDPDWSNFSLSVKTAYEKGNTEEWVDICHVIQPNPDHDENRLDPRFKRYSSIYYEKGRSDDDGKKFLRESGFDRFPILAPRWEVNGEDVYGITCPGMESLGDVKQLQLGEKKIMAAVEKLVNPPMTGPTALKTVPSSILPGGTTWVDTREGQHGFRPAHEVDPRILELENKQEQTRKRIQRTHFEDLFLMMSQSDRREITAREIEERHEEKLVALGPVLEQTNQDLLNPLIDLTFDIMVRQGKIPEPPEELEGTKLKVEYVSIMAQAQKLLGIGSLERFAGFVGNIVAQTGDPTRLDKVDVDQMIDVYADLTSVPSGVVRSDEDVEEIRSRRSQAQAAQATITGLREAAAGAKDLAGANLETDNALKRLVEAGNAGSAVPS